VTKQILVHTPHFVFVPFYIDVINIILLLAKCNVSSMVCKMFAKSECKSIISVPEPNSWELVNDMIPLVKAPTFHHIASQPETI
jgi:hypothetical protein